MHPGKQLRAIDLFSGAGGAGEGYSRAGFDVTGIDDRPQPHYPHRFVRADVFTLDWARFAAADLIHASPPCHDHMRSPMPGQADHGTAWMLAETRRRLEATGRPWVIENVPGARMRADYKLCGCMFGLWRLGRERWFETSWRGFDLRPPCLHPDPLVEVYGGGGRSMGRPGAKGTTAERRRAMGIEWMTRRELSQAIPPAYTEYIGRQFLATLA